jgi:4-hydroxy-tetrahydrodipicolinate reductase
MVKHGINVVSSCEELLFPQLCEPLLAAKLDRACRKSGARVLGTGVNPGFVMDVLPLCLTGVSCAIREIHVERVVNASTRRGPLQKKIGSGLPPREFRRLLRAGQAGHAGLKESLALLAHGLGWRVEEIAENGNAIIAERAIRTDHIEVKRGQTCGLHQRVEAKAGGSIRLTLDLKMYLDAPDPRDAVRIEGDPPVEVVIPGGIAGDQATVAALLNNAPRLLQAEPGLRLMTDLALPRMA